MKQALFGSRRAFTLIELLIVVAIIGILAAIAIPNFLQAQVRSKVARVYADMRSVAVGIEAYYVDNNSYPRDAQYGGEFLSFLPRMKTLTTPIEYISTIPEDVFADKSTVGTAPWNAAYQIPYGSGNFFRPFPFDFANRILPTGAWESRAVWARFCSQPDVCLWAMRSVGPDHFATFLGYTVQVYDPTNGTVSEGDIFFTGPGKGIDKPEGT